MGEGKGRLMLHLRDIIPHPQLSYWKHIYLSDRMGVFCYRLTMIIVGLGYILVIPWFVRSYDAIMPSVSECIIARTCVEPWYNGFITFSCM